MVFKVPRQRDGQSVLQFMKFLDRLFVKKNGRDEHFMKRRIVKAKWLINGMEETVKALLGPTTIRDYKKGLVNWNDIKEQVQDVESSFILSSKTLLDPSGASPSYKLNNRDLYEDENHYVRVNTDGSCIYVGKSRSNVQVGGVGVYFKDAHAANLSASFLPKKNDGLVTNQKAEIAAAHFALLQAKKHEIKRLRILTDSSHVVDSMTLWVRDWLQNGWIKANTYNDAVVHKNQFRELILAIRHLDDVVFVLVGREENKEADELAKQGSEKMKNRIIFSRG